MEEVDCWQAMVCKVVGSRPSRGDVDKIVDMLTLGRRYYQLEFEIPNMAARVLACSLLALCAGRLHFCSWCHGFDPSI